MAERINIPANEGPDRIYASELSVQPIRQINRPATVRDSQDMPAINISTDSGIIRKIAQK